MGIHSDNKPDFWDAVLGLLDALGDAYDDIHRDDAGTPSRVGETAIPMQMEALRKAGEGEREAVGRLLQMLRELILAAGDASAVPSLLGSLRDEKAAVRRASARMLGWIGDPAATSGLLDALRDGDPDLRCEAAEALGKIGSVDAITGLLEALRDKQGKVRYASAWALGKIGDKSAVSGLIETLKDEERDVRRAAARALGWIGRSEAVPGLLDALQDKSSGVRRDAAGALGRIGDTRAVSGLLKALTDQREPVRYAAAESLGRIGDTGAVQGLIEALADTGMDVRRAAAEALRSIGDPRAIPALLHALRRARETDDEPGAYALGVAAYEMLTASLPAEAPAFGTATSKLIDPVTEIAKPVKELVGSMLERQAAGGAKKSDEVVRRIEKLVEEHPPGGHPPAQPPQVPEEQAVAPAHAVPTMHHADTDPKPKPGPSAGGFALVPPSGEPVSLSLPEVIIGRSRAGDESPPDVDLRVLGAKNARTVSRRHCRIYRQGEDYFIEDMESLNGTRLNELELEPRRSYRLNDGDQILAGRVPLTFRLENKAPTD